MQTIIKTIAVMLVLALSYQFTLQIKINFTGKTVTFKSADDITVTGDIYESAKEDFPIILLFHQAGYSRGEYREIAPKLQNMGYTCLAIDQRSGKKVNGVVNETHIEANKEGLKTKYPDAFVDLEAALNYAKKNYSDRKIIVWGSSYSSSLVFILANKYPKDISAVLSFSPGEYFTFDGKKVEDYAKEVNCPVFVTSAKNEHKSWAAIFEAIPITQKISFIPTSKGFHGSKALWEEKSGHEEYWKAVNAFLGGI